MSDWMTRVLLFLAAAVLVTSGTTALLLADTLTLRYERDVSRMVFNDNVQVLAELRRRLGEDEDSLAGIAAGRQAPAMNQPYIVVSIEDHRLWLRRGDSILFTAPVATGSGKILERTGTDMHWRFETPRGRLAVISKEVDPIWVAPDWYYVEQAQKLGLGVVRLARGQRLRTGAGAITVMGSDVVLVDSAGNATPFRVVEDREIVALGNLVIPPFGTNQRKYAGVLGTHRLNLGDGYSIHGTNKPETIGRSVSHGCVRVRNEDVARLYEMVEVGTPVFIY